MKTFRIIYRVPACAKHGSYLSETTIQANEGDKLQAVARFAREYPGCIVQTVFNGI